MVLQKKEKSKKIELRERRKRRRTFKNIQEVNKSIDKLNSHSNHKEKEDLTRLEAQHRQTSLITFSKIHLSLWDLDIKMLRVIDKVLDSEIHSLTIELWMKISFFHHLLDHLALEASLKIRTLWKCRISFPLTLINLLLISLKTSDPLMLLMMISCKESWKCQHRDNKQKETLLRKMQSKDCLLLLFNKFIVRRSKVPVNSNPLCAQFAKRILILEVKLCSCLVDILFTLIVLILGLKIITLALSADTNYLVKNEID